jgi:hypothetical protein
MDASIANKGESENIHSINQWNKSLQIKITGTRVKVRHNIKY